MSIVCSKCSHINSSAKPGDPCDVCSSVLGSSTSLTTTQDWVLQIRTFGLELCEGTLIHDKELRDKEEPDPDMPGILAKILLFLDVFLGLGSLGLLILGFGMIFIIIGLIFSIGCILPVMAIMGQVFLFAFIKTLRSVFGNRPEPVSVTNYEIQTLSGVSKIVKLKGSLRGASPRENDRVKFWGVKKDGILHFRCGLNTTTGVPYLRPSSNSVIWLAILVFLNLIFGLWIFISMLATNGS